MGALQAWTEGRKSKFLYPWEMREGLEIHAFLGEEDPGSRGEMNVQGKLFRWAKGHESQD